MSSSLDLKNASRYVEIVLLCACLLRAYMFFSVKRKQEDSESSDSHKKLKREPFIRLTSQTNGAIAFNITGKAINLGRNTPELQSLVGNDTFVSRHACSVVARSDGRGAVLSVVCKMH